VSKYIHFVIHPSIFEAFEQSGGNAFEFFRRTALLPREDVARIIEETGFLKAIARQFRLSMVGALFFNDKAGWLPPDADLAWIEKNIVEPFEVNLRETLSYRAGAAAAEAVAEAFNVLEGAIFSAGQLRRMERRFGELGRAPILLTRDGRGRRPKITDEGLRAAINYCGAGAKQKEVANYLRVSATALREYGQARGFKGWKEFRAHLEKRRK
jgi:hypothetical protein